MYNKVNHRERVTDRYCDLNKCFTIWILRKRKFIQIYSIYNQLEETSKNLKKQQKAII